MLEEEYQPRRKLPPHLQAARPSRRPRSSSRSAMRRLADLPSVREIYNHYVLQLDGHLRRDAR